MWTVVTGASGQSLLAKTTFPCTSSWKASAPVQAVTLSTDTGCALTVELNCICCGCITFTEDIDAAAKLISEDDDMMGKNIDMPWWDPSYVRPDKKQDLVGLPQWLQKWSLL